MLQKPDAGHSNGSYADRQTDRQTHRHTDRHTDRQTDRVVA